MSTSPLACSASSATNSLSTTACGEKRKFSEDSYDCPERCAKSARLVPIPTWDRVPIDYPSTPEQVELFFDGCSAYEEAVRLLRGIFTTHSQPFVEFRNRWDYNLPCDNRGRLFPSLKYESLPSYLCTELQTERQHLRDSVMAVSDLFDFSRQVLKGLEEILELYVRYIIGIKGSTDAATLRKKYGNFAQFMEKWWECRVRVARYESWDEYCELTNVFWDLGFKEWYHSTHCNIRYYQAYGDVSRKSLGGLKKGAGFLKDFVRTLGSEKEQLLSWL